jgi:hypothetical protein
MVTMIVINVVKVYDDNCITTRVIVNQLYGV